MARQIVDALDAAHGKGIVHRDLKPVNVKITPDGVVEYIDSKKPSAVVDFGSLSRIRLRVSGRTFSDSIQVRLDVWLDLHYRDGSQSKWRSASFSSQFRTVQAFIEAYGAHQALRSGSLYPQ